MPAERPAKIFTKFAKGTSSAAGHPITFGLAVLIILVWGVTGPLFAFSDTWQLIINTGTTIVTFLMVFLIQNTQNRDSHALQIKIDEILRVTEGAHIVLLDLEELEDKELKQIRRNYTDLACKARKEIENGGNDTDVPEVAAEDCVAANV
jgi:low affinity Fe/Cu permease